MVSVDDFVPGGGMAGGALPVRPHAAILGPAAASPRMPACGAGISWDFDGSYPANRRNRVLQSRKWRWKPWVRERPRGPDHRFTNQFSARCAPTARTLFEIDQ